MPITIQYAPNANLVGQAAFEGGYGEYLRAEQARQLQLAQFAEQQRQFNERQGMAQQEFDANREDMQFRQNQVGRQDYLQRYALQQRAAEQQAHAANQQMALDYGLQREAMQGQLGLQREYLQQQGNSQREAMGNRALMDRTRFEAEQKAAATDEMNLRAAIQRGQLDNDQIDEAWRRLEAKWPNVYNGTQPPPLPDWQSQEAQWAKATPWAEERGLQLVPDENGMPSIMRGTPAYGQTQEGMDRQHQHKMEETDRQNQSKEQAAEGKMYRDAVSDEQTLRSKIAISDLNAQAEYRSAKIKLITDIAAAKKNIANTKKVGIGETAPDLTEAENAVKDMEDMLAKMTPPPSSGQGLFPAGPMSQGSPVQPMTPGISAQEATMPPATGKPYWETLDRQESGERTYNTDDWKPGYRYYDADNNRVVEITKVDGNSSESVSYIPVNSPEEAAKLNVKKGTRVILPDGRTGVTK